MSNISKKINLFHKDSPNKVIIPRTGRYHNIKLSRGISSILNKVNLNYINKINNPNNSSTTNKVKTNSTKVNPKVNINNTRMINKMGITKVNNSVPDQ
ncbi:unnamed protein product [Bursaphelenchus xylophilus]|uniref:(pine wood nematode) hypothetical protein n=1 Tax=Bursaphelenchus xylophilus TaxID=6326 RepID=A0A7I8WSL4_BURXY|nr:unnamed protein product [Bursaphelenchus xylophilus]CAG9115586.1 unnamed protein product [Bursaphelenchus xylophilus]